MYPSIKCTTKHWCDLCHFYIYGKVIFFFFFFFFFFCLKNIFLLFFAEFELSMFHISERYFENFRKFEQAELVENLPSIYLPYRFLHNLKPRFETVGLYWICLVISSFLPSVIPSFLPSSYQINFRRTFLKHCKGYKVETWYTHTQ